PIGEVTVLVVVELFDQPAGRLVEDQGVYRLSGRVEGHAEAGLTIVGGHWAEQLDARDQCRGLVEGSADDRRHIALAHEISDIPEPFAGRVRAAVPLVDLLEQGRRVCRERCPVVGRETETTCGEAVAERVVLRPGIWDLEQGTGLSVGRGGEVTVR